MFPRKGNRENIFSDCYWQIKKNIQVHTRKIGFKKKYPLMKGYFKV